MFKERSERLFLILIIISMCIWGFSWSSAKVLSGYGSPSALALIRFILVPITLSVYAFFAKIDLKIDKKGLLYLLGAGFFMMVYTLYFFQGLKNGYAGAGGVLVTTLNPIFAYLLGLVVSRTFPSKKEIIGLLIGVLAGLFLLHIWQKSNQILDLGNTYFLIAAFVWALMSKFSAQANRFGNAIAFSVWLHLLSVIGLFFVADLKEVKSILMNGDSKFWANILYFGIINSSLATTTYLYATAKIGAEKASTFIFLVPATAALGSWMILDEQIQWYTIIGGLLGVLAVFVLNKRD